MSRRTFAIRNLRPTLPEPDVAARYLLAWHGPALYTDPAAFAPLTAPALFGAPGPLAVEIGCGTGEFLCALAASAPVTPFLGIDSSLKSLHVAVAQAQALGLSNIRFLWAQIEGLYPLLRPATLGAVYLHFPDPCLQAKQRHRWIFTPVLRAAVAAALVPGGLFSVLTDVPARFAEMDAALATDARFAPHPAPPAWPAAVRSRYEAKWARHGIVPLGRVVQKVG